MLSMLLRGQNSRANNKGRETTLSKGRGGLNILYPLVSKDIRAKMCDIRFSQLLLSMIVGQLLNSVYFFLFY